MTAGTDIPMPQGPRWYMMRPFKNRGYAITVNPHYNPWDYHLNDDNAAVIKRWIPAFDPDNADIPALEALMLTEFRFPPSECQELTWPQIIAILATRNHAAEPQIPVGQAEGVSEPKEQSDPLHNTSAGNWQVKIEGVKHENITLTGIDKNGPKTLGGLLDAVQKSEIAYSRNIAVAERYETQHNASGQWWRIQSELLVFQPDPLEWPGIDVMEAICQAEFGSGLTANNIRRVRGTLVVKSGKPPVEVDCMTIRQVVDELQRLKCRTTNGDIANSISNVKESKGRKVKRYKRNSLSPEDEAKLLETCRRRCCICFVLENDASQKDGQLAHLDHDHSNGDPDNFVFLCLRHHNIYDSKMIQAKNMTEHEVRLHRKRLYEAVECGEVPLRLGPTVLKFPVQQTTPMTVNGDGNIVAARDVNLTVNISKPKRGKGRSATRPPIIPGTVSEDPRMVGYLNYLVRRYEKFKNWECERNGQDMGYGVIRNSYKRDMKYELIHTPKTLFDAGMRYLQKRIENTQLGKMKRTQKLYSVFQDFDEQASNNEPLPA
ncbi:MAG: hypothetical protein EHM48_02425 [Planctomycetaceae bacterium]|nr:MAG: hypothetical protein EHM48_02425 [Planctomycetaceae bacterium]